MSTLQVVPLHHRRPARRPARRPGRRPAGRAPGGRSDVGRPSGSTTGERPAAGFSRPVGLTVMPVFEASPAAGAVSQEPPCPALTASTTRLTRRGRLVLVLAFLGLALGVMTAVGGFAAATRHPGSPEPVRVVEVAPGDTLYSLAGEVAEPGHVREMVHRIQELNSLSGATLQVGQRLAVPRD